MKTYIGFLLVLLFSSTSFAAYPPFAESALYINTALNDARVVNELGINNAIKSINFSGTVITISAGDCSLDVEVKTLPQDGTIPPSPTPKFELILGQKNCK